MKKTIRLTMLGLLATCLWNCSPASFLLRPIYPTKEGVVSQEYRGLSPRELEATFVRPLTERPLMETSGETAALLYDYAHLEASVRGKSGAEDALGSMMVRYVDAGLSFRVVVWGRGMREVDLSRYRFRLEVDGGQILEPVSFEPAGSPTMVRRVGEGVLWHGVADVTFPIAYAPPLSSATLLIEGPEEGIVVDRHHWKFDWKG